MGRQRSIQFQYIPYQYVQIPCCWLIITAKEEKGAIIVSRVTQAHKTINSYQIIGLTIIMLYNDSSHTRWNILTKCPCFKSESSNEFNAVNMSVIDSVYALITDAVSLFSYSQTLPAAVSQSNSINFIVTRCLKIVRPQNTHLVPAAWYGQSILSLQGKNSRVK